MIYLLLEGYFFAKVKARMYYPESLFETSFVLFLLQIADEMKDWKKVPTTPIALMFPTLIVTWSS